MNTLNIEYTVFCMELVRLTVVLLMLLTLNLKAAVAARLSFRNQAQRVMKDQPRCNFWRVSRPAVKLLRLRGEGLHPVLSEQNDWSALRMPNALRNHAT